MEESSNLEQQLREVRRLLDKERQKNEHLRAENELMKLQNIEMYVKAEAEEECLVNRLMKRLNEIKREKELVINEAEREEEYLTNGLQRRLFALSREKEQLERQLLQENHLETEKLQHQLTQLRQDHEHLARQLESEEESLTNSFQAQISKMRQEKDVLQRKLQELRSTVIGGLKQELEQEKKEKTLLIRRSKQLVAAVQSFLECPELKAMCVTDSDVTSEAEGGGESDTDISDAARARTTSLSSMTSTMNRTYSHTSLSSDVTMLENCQNETMDGTNDTENTSNCACAQYSNTMKAQLANLRALTDHLRQVL